MLKLLVVDDEEFICKSIASLIDWNSYGISLIGICLDGVEAYHMILDEAPDIVMTYGEISMVPFCKDISVLHLEGGGRIIKFYNWEKPYYFDDHLY